LPSDIFVKFSTFFGICKPISTYKPQFLPDPYTCTHLTSSLTHNLFLVNPKFNSNISQLTKQPSNNPKVLTGVELLQSASRRSSISLDISAADRIIWFSNRQTKLFLTKIALTHTIPFCG